MASLSHFLTLKLGTQNVSLAEFKSTKNGGLILSRVEESGLVADPSADATRVAQTKMAIAELSTKIKRKGSHIRVSLASQSAFSRFIKLPSVEGQDIAKLVEFEAAQNIPYPMNEVVWDFQPIESRKSGEKEALIAAIKSDLLAEVNGAIESGNLETEGFDLSPLALANSFLFNYPDYDGCSMIVDVGARTTNLVFVESGRVFYRSISSGGSSVTGAIAKEFQESFAEAESRKVEHGFIALGGNYADPEDEDVAKLSKVIRNAMTRLHAEIARSISFYRSQQGGSAPSRILLAGGGVSLPYSREFFEEKLAVPSEFFNPLLKLSLAPGIDAEKVAGLAHTWGEHVGLALRMIRECPVALRLVPPSTLQRQTQRRMVPAAALAFLLLNSALLGWKGHFDAVTAEADQLSAQLKKETKTFEDVDRSIKEKRQNLRKRYESSLPFHQAIADRDYWVKVISDIHQRLPEEFVWITNLHFAKTAAEEPVSTPKTQETSPKPSSRRNNEPDIEAPISLPPLTIPNGTIEIQGLYLLNPKGVGIVDDFLALLDKSDLYSVNKEKITRVDQSSNSEEWAYKFSVQLQPKNFHVKTSPAPSADNSNPTQPQGSSK
jgi:type IV pilus assembly protein PilM